jgi:hypothetical protein
MPDLGDPAIDDRYADRRQLTHTEQRNVAQLERWRDLFNGDDMERFVRDAYAPTFRVVNLDGSSWTGNATHRENILDDAEMFIRAETFIKQAAPGRRIRFNRVIPAGDVITLEASLLDDARPGWELSWCGVYTFDADGLIVSDHSYLNRRDWPGISELLGR